MLININSQNIIHLYINFEIISIPININSQNTIRLYIIFVLGCTYCARSKIQLPNHLPKMSDTCKLSEKCSLDGWHKKTCSQRQFIKDSTPKTFPTKTGSL